MNPWHVVIVLAVYTVIREVIQTLHIHKMINKIMATNYRDYAFPPSSVKIGQNDQASSGTFGEDVAEDLGALSGIV